MTEKTRNKEKEEEERESEKKKQEREWKKISGRNGLSSLSQLAHHLVFKKGIYANCYL